MFGLFKSIDEFPGAVIGRIHGATLGGGLGLLSCCDVSIAVPDIKLAFSEVRLGLVPAVISPFVMNKISIADARVLFMTGQGFSSQKAQAMGLITEVVEPENLDATVEKYVRRFLVAGPKAMVEAKRLVREVTLREREDALGFAVSKLLSCAHRKRARSLLHSSRNESRAGCHEGTHCQPGRNRVSSSRNAPEEKYSIRRDLQRC